MPCVFQSRLGSLAYAEGAPWDSRSLRLKLVSLFIVIVIVIIIIIIIIIICILSIIIINQSLGS